jgi:hypothetical protein
MQPPSPHTYSRPREIHTTPFPTSARGNAETVEVISTKINDDKKAEEKYKEKATRRDIPPVSSNYHHDGSYRVTESSSNERRTDNVQPGVEVYQSVYHHRRIEQTVFPSERYKSVRTTETVHYDQPEVVQEAVPKDDDAIQQAIRILEASCTMLDETAERIARRKKQPSSRVQFPSEIRSKTVEIQTIRS